MSKTETGQVNTSAAEVYENLFVPALFGEWSERAVHETNIRRGQKVLDVACGTGILACEVAKMVGSEGSVTGLDLNEGMLAVAEKKYPHINWKHGEAESLPFEDETFNAVVCQFGLMFFPKKTLAIREMFRVLKGNGKLVIAVWDTLENCVGFKAIVDLLDRLFGKEMATSLHPPFDLGDKEKLKSIFGEAGVSDINIKTINGKGKFPSIKSWMFTQIKGWTLADLIDDKQFQQILNEAEKDFKKFVIEDGSVEFKQPAHIITAEKP